MRLNNRKGSLPLAALAVIGILSVGIAVFSSQFKANSKSNAAVLSESSTQFSIESANAIANQDGSTLTMGANKAWYGNAQSVSSSYLGLNFTGGNIPANAQIKSAKVEFTATGSWITVSSTFYADTSKVGNFSSGSKPSSRTLTSSNMAYSDNVKWDANTTYSFDVTAPVSELVNSQGATFITLIAKGSGGQWGRKDIYGNPSTGKSPKLTVVYATGAGATSTPTASPTPTATAKPTATATVAPTASLRPTSSPIVGGGSPTPTTTMPPTMSMSPTASPISSTEAIYGATSVDILGNCPANVHDRYVVRGPDGVLYRTWHPQTVSVDAAKPSGVKCTFAHEHGDDPAKSNIYAGPVPFDYVPHLAGMDEPHVGFKCFVQNKGLTNNEGGVALMDTYYCFHMGTGGAGRFTTQFHSLDFHVRTATGVRMDIAGLADVGNVGTICDDPRQSRTVMGLGCKLDSPYEIWLDTLSIVNKGNPVATAVVSTAVFDPITVMDPADKTKLIYSWDPLARSQIFKFNDDRTQDRGCVREAYTGPLMWYNKGKSQTYYTDVYGNVVDGGVVKQTISSANTSDAGSLTQYGGLILATSGSFVQFKYQESTCAPGLGLKN